MSKPRVYKTDGQWRASQMVPTQEGVSWVGRGFGSFTEAIAYVTRERS